MILIDRKPLSIEALNDSKHPHYDFAVEYNNTIQDLHERYKNGFVRFLRPNAVRYTKGMDSAGREIPKMAEPVQPWRIPLKANTVLGKLGKHSFMCCLDMPTVLPNGLWDMGSKKAMTIKEDLLVNVNEEPDLAFFLYKVSPFVRRGLLKVADPKKDDEEMGEAERELTERKYAVWNMLADEDKLRTMARAYGVAGIDNKQPNAIRKELETTLEKNDVLRKQNPAVRGTREFLEEMRVTDGVLLRAFIQKAIDDKKLSANINGWWKIGDKQIVQVPQNELKRRLDYLCNYLSSGSNTERLQEFMRDLVNKDYLDSLPAKDKDDKKVWVWLGKIANVPTNFKKLEEIKTGVYQFYCPI